MIGQMRESDVSNEQDAFRIGISQKTPRGEFVFRDGFIVEILPALLVEKTLYRVFHQDRGDCLWGRDS